MDSFVRYVLAHENDDTASLLLGRDKVSGLDVSLAVSTIEGRRRMKAKNSRWYNVPALIYTDRLSVEQCSSMATATYKARMAAGILAEQAQDSGMPDKPATIADLTGGLGVDSAAFAEVAERVIYNEMNPVLVEAARHNFKELGKRNIALICSKIESGFSSNASFGDLHPDLLYLDPARRSASGRKVFLIEECSPNVAALKAELMVFAPDVLIKLSPMADISMLIRRLGPEVREVHIVGSGGECREVLVWLSRGWQEEAGITASECHYSPEGEFAHSDFAFTLSEEATARPRITDSTSLKGRLLAVPSSTLLKAGAFNTITKRFSMEALGVSTHLYITDELLPTAFFKYYRIMEVHTLNKRTMEDVGRRYPYAEVSVKGLPFGSDDLRESLECAPGATVHIFGVQTAFLGRLLIVTEPIKL